MQRISIFVLIVIALIVCVAPAPAVERPRIVSLIPAVTELLFAIGAGDDVVGVSRYDHVPEAVRTRTPVGGMLDPATETILALRPTLVIVYETQTSLRIALDRAGIRTMLYRHEALGSIGEVIRQLGDATGHQREARTLRDRMDHEFAVLREEAARRPRPRVLLVVSRPPQSLQGVRVAGGAGFLNDVLECAGGRNVFADTARSSTEVSLEEIVTRRPDVIVELWPNRSPSAGLDRERDVWNSLMSIPAVRFRRVFEVVDDRPVVPGPRLPSGIRVLAELLHRDLR